MKNKLDFRIKGLIEQTMTNWPKCPFYYKVEEKGLRIYCYQKSVWDMIERAEEIFGWGSIHGGGVEPVTRLDDELSTFIVRGYSPDDGL